VTCDLRVMTTEGSAGANNG